MNSEESQPAAPAVEELPEGPLHSERAGAGCLLGLGILMLIPVIPILCWSAWDTFESAFNVTHSSDWAYRWAAWAGRIGSLNVSGIAVLLFLLGYCVLLWQWAAFEFGWKVLIEPRRLWAVSSAYFAAAIVLVVLITCSIAETFAGALSGSVWFSMVPAFFLLMTLRLWALRKRAMLSPRDRAQKLAQESLVLTIRPNDEANGVGCLVLLGLVALLILIPLLFVQMSANLRALRDALDWSGVAAFGRSLWRWFWHGGNSMPAWFSFFGLGFCLFFWQWVAYFYRRRTILAPRWLWALSSAYFLVLILAVAALSWPGWKTMNAHSNANQGGAFSSWIIAMLYFSTFPGTFLCFTLPLWVMSWWGRRWSDGVME